jgi:hypothetical protein
MHTVFRSGQAGQIQATQTKAATDLGRHKPSPRKPGPTCRYLQICGVYTLTCRSLHKFADLAGFKLTSYGGGFAALWRYPDRSSPAQLPGIPYPWLPSAWRVPKVGHTSRYHRQKCKLTIDCTTCTHAPAQLIASFP